MRFVRTELSPANKKQYTMAMGKKDIELLYEMALNAHRYMPNTSYLKDDKRRLASIAKAFGQAMKTVEYDSDEGERLPLEERQKFKDELEKNPLYEINRFEVIDHRPCVKCHGKGWIHTDTVTRGHGSEAISMTYPVACDVCSGNGMKGREVIFWDNKTQVTSSIQDEGRTMKLFLNEREEPLNEVPPKLKALMERDGDTVGKILEMLDKTHEPKKND